MKFDAYEFIAVIIPGALPALAVALLVPEVAAFLKSDGIDFGGFGVFLIVSYILGHAVQVVGNGIEKVEGMIGFGMLDMAVRPERRPIDSEQWGRFIIRLNECGIGSSEPTNQTWPGIRREVYARLMAAGQTERIDMFNRVYGLCRGMVAGALSTAGLIFILGEFTQWKTLTVAIMILALLLYIRMRRFSAHYFKEIVSQFTSFDSNT